jgi:hypothetical protein
VDGAYLLVNKTGTAQTNPWIKFRCKCEKHLYFDQYVYLNIKDADAAGEIVAPTAKKNIVYDGQSHSLMNKGSTSVGKMFYSVNGSGWQTWEMERSNDDPETLKGTEAGLYTINWKVTQGKKNDDTTADDPTVKSGTLYVTIEKATNPVQIKAVDVPFDGNPHKLVSVPDTVSQTYDIQYAVGASTNYSTVVPTATEPNTYKVFFKIAETSNYLESTGYVTSKITKGTIKLTDQPEALNPTYNGTVQPLVKDGSVSTGYDIVYRVAGEDNYSKTIPTKKEADQYTVQ